MKRTATAYYKGEVPAQVLKYVLDLGLRKHLSMVQFFVISHLKPARAAGLSREKVRNVVWQYVLNTEIPGVEWREGKMRDYFVWYAAYPEVQPHPLDAASTPEYTKA